MVEDTITDGKRIAQLLSSELSGRDDSGLDAVSVVDADPDAEPTPDGAHAYVVEWRDERVAAVAMFLDHVAVVVTLEPDTVQARAEELDLPIESDEGRGVVFRVESGAAVKRAVDALLAGVDSAE